MGISSIRRLMISNIGPFGPAPITIEISDIVCLVGVNNSGKSTVLDAYQLALDGKPLELSKVHLGATEDPFVELWIETPVGTPRIGEKWIKDDYPEYPNTGIVRSRWSWSLASNLKCRRTTFDKYTDTFSNDEKASGLDSVFASRLPKPLRIRALQHPEKDSLLKIVLDPIISSLRDIEKDESSDLAKAIEAIRKTLSIELKKYDHKAKEVQQSVETQFGSIFENSKISIKIEPAGEIFNLENCIKNNTDILVGDTDRLLPMECQGTGAQRALFWSLLKVRSSMLKEEDDRKNNERAISEKHSELSKAKLKIDGLEKKEKPTKNTLKDLVDLRSRISSLEAEILDKTDTFNRGHILMIDEPEIALHPSAVRAAKDQLYKLAEEEGWQVIMTTHHPAFIDPTKDHTTIVRLDKQHDTSLTYRSDLAKFDEDEKQELSALLKFDMAFCEIFFAKEVYIVEGDTEYAIFQELFSQRVSETQKRHDSVIVRAGGKGTIPLILRILRQFKIPQFLLHDVDSPKIKTGGKNSAAYTNNRTILTEVDKTKAEGIKIIHKVSVPNFESANEVASTGRGKPLDAVRQLKVDPDFKNRIQQVLNELNGSSENLTPGEHYEKLLKAWIEVNKVNDKKYRFSK